MHLVTFERLSGPNPHGEGRRSSRSLPSMRDAALGFDLDPLFPGQRRLGALLTLGAHAGSVVDLNRALAVKLAAEDVGAPEAEADSLLPPDIHAFLRRSEDSLAPAEEALAFATGALERYDAPDVLRAGVVEPRNAVRLCAPVPRPGKIVAVARNYPAHAAERGARKPPEEPVLFLKAPSAVIGPEDEIEIPAVCTQPDYEGELALVIGRRTSCVPRGEALDCVAGYCAANDVTARDFQNQRGQHFLGKSCDSFAPLGPVLVTRDEIPDPQNLLIRTSVSGETRQSGSTKEMLFSAAALIEFASALMTLEPGDVLLTGTPAGVGAAHSPPRWLRDGDLVEVEVEKIGRLRNYVRRRARP